jgi:hypothetical protein
MGDSWNPEELARTFELFHHELNSGKSLKDLPLKHIDWNSLDGREFLKKRCRSGDGDDVVNHLRILRLKDESAIEIICVAIAGGARIENIPAELTFHGGKDKCKAIWDTVVEYRKGKEYLGLLRSCRGGDNEKKIQAYDYVVLEYRYKGLGELPESKVIFGKFEEEEREARERERLNEEQKLIEEKNYKEEQKQAFIKKRRSLLTPPKMKFLTRELKEKGVSAIKTLWRSDALGALHHYVDADDVRDFPEFTNTLTKVIDNAIEKGFEETYRCVRAFPLLYGGQIRYDVPKVIEKAFKTYPMLLKAVEKEFLDLDPREKQDYFFFTKVAVTNPEFDWGTINLERLPEDGVIIYNDREEEVALSLQQQLDEIVIAAHEAGLTKSIPKEFGGYHHTQIGVLTILVNWRDRIKKARADKTAAPAAQNKGEKKGSWISRLFGKR